MQRRRRGAVAARARERPQLRLAERSERQHAAAAGERGGLEPAVVARSRLAVAKRADDQERKRRALAREEADELARGGVGPLEVVQRHDQRRAPREPGEGARPAVEERERVARRRERVARRGVRPRQHVLERRPLLRAEGRRADRLGQRARRLRPRPARRHVDVLVAAAPGGERAVGRGGREQLLDEPRLADAGLARHEDDARGPRARRVELGAQPGQLGASPDEAGAGGGAIAGARRGRDGHREPQPVAVHRLDAPGAARLVADRDPRAPHALAHRRVADDRVGPERAQHLRARQQRAGALGEQHEQIEGLRIHVDDAAVSAQQALGGIELAVGETEQHRRSSGSISVRQKGRGAVPA